MIKDREREKTVFKFYVFPFEVRRKLMMMMMMMMRGGSMTNSVMRRRLCSSSNNQPVYRGLGSGFLLYGLGTYRTEKKKNTISFLTDTIR